MLYNDYESVNTDTGNGIIFKEPIVQVKFSCVYSTVIDVGEQHIVEASFAKGSANAEGQVLGGFELETYSDPDFSIEQSSGFRTGDVMYFDVTIDKKISNLEFVGKFQLFNMIHSVFYFDPRDLYSTLTPDQILSD